MRERAAAEIEEAAKPGVIGINVDKWDQQSPFRTLFGAGVARSYIRTIRRCE
jgi:hypothetical protein